MAGLVKMAIDRYTTVLDRISDPRVHEWPMMNNPIPTVAMVLTYLYLVIILGPRIMANRKPFKLRSVLIAYNAFQVLYSSAMLYEHLMSGWLSDYSYKCQPVDYSHSQTAVRMLNLCWWYYISKLTEFADTIFFILRKKDSQVTFLHLYHHSLTPIETWVLVKFIAGGHGTFSNLVNNVVHIIMYFYYMMSAMGPEYQKYLWWKKHLTHLQLLQFTLVFFHSWSALFNDCGYPKIIAAFLVFHSVVFFALFGNFYLQTYKKQKQIAAKSAAAATDSSTEAIEAKENGTTTNGTISNGNIANGTIVKEKITNGLVHRHIGNGTANGILNSTPNGIANGTVNSIANGTPNGLVNGKPNSIANGRPNGTANGKPNGMANGTLNGTPNGMANSVVNGVANGMANGVANGVLNEMANSVANGTPNGTVHCNRRPNISVNITAYGTANGRVNGLANSTVSGRANGTVNGAINGIVKKGDSFNNNIRAKED